jgi:beta-lactamase class D
VASDFEISVMNELADIKSLATQANASALAAKEASIASTHAMSERLFDPQSGVICTLQSGIQEIKDDRIREARWEKIHNIAHYSLGPILIALHEIARKMGMNI